MRAIRLITGALIVASAALAGCGQPNYNGTPLGGPDGGTVVPIQQGGNDGGQSNCVSGPVTIDKVDQAALAAMTGYGQEEDRERARAAGFDHHLTKPVDLARLREILATLPTTEDDRRR